MGEDEALAQFAAGSEGKARQAFDVLAVGARPYLHAYLRRTTGLAEDVREDVIQDTLARAWGVRGSYRDEGVAAWHGFLKTTAWRVCVDLSRRRSEVPRDGALLAETAEAEHTATVGALLDALDAQTALHQADLLWLGLDPSLPPEAHTRRLLAAQFFYLEALPWADVRRLLGPPPPGDPPLTRAALDAWLADPGVLRHLTYETLYYGNDRLAARLLGLDDPPPPGALDAVSRAAAASAPTAAGPGGWTWAQAAVILWRYRAALLFDQILQRDDCAFTPDALAVLLDRTLTCFPFSEEMTSLGAVLGAGGRLLSHRGLWQRLAFQYKYVDDLPHQDIRDRTQPAYRHVAEPAQPEITLGMLNVWLSNGRLLERLARACRGQKGEDDE